MAVIACTNIINNKGALLINQEVTCTGNETNGHLGYATFTVDVGNLVPKGIAANTACDSSYHGGGVGFFNSEGMLENIASGVFESDGSREATRDSEIYCAYENNGNQTCSILSASYADGIITIEVESYDYSRSNPYSKTENISFYVF